MKTNELIKAACKERGTTLHALEQRLQLGNGAISKWAKSRPSAYTLNLIAKELDVPLESIIGD